MLTKLVLATAAATAVAGCAVFAPAPAVPSNDRIDKLFTQWNRPDSPGCSVGVSRDGRIEYERAYGMANLELNVPLTPDSSLEAASISKQFTAMSILSWRSAGCCRSTTR